MNLTNDQINPFLKIPVMMSRHFLPQKCHLQKFTARSDDDIGAS